MRIAMTGTTGLMGSAVARTLAAAGHTIVSVGRSSGCDVRFDLVKDSSLGKKALAGCDALIHAAGVIDEDFVVDPDAARVKATTGAEALVEAARDSGVGRLAYISSAHVYGPLVGRIEEDRPPNPQSPYAKSHFMTEERFRASKASLLIARPCATFGTLPVPERFARWGLIPFGFPREALGGRIVLKSAGEQRRNFVSSEGVGSLVGWWLDREAPGESLINATGPHEMSVYEFALLCARIAQEETGRPCSVERPAPQPGAAAPGEPLEYRSRVGGHLPGPLLEDHVRGMVRALMKKAHP